MSAFLKDPLTKRELEVLRQLATGMSNADLAKVLVLEISSVETHLSNIYSKLGVTSRSQAIIWAIESGIASVSKR